MKKNLQLTAFALALCLGLNAQNKSVGSQQPVMPTTGGSHQQSDHKHQANPGRCGTQTPHGEWENWSAEKL